MEPICSGLHGVIFQNMLKILRGLSSRVNYTDRVTAACFADRGCHVVSVTSPYGRILGFVDVHKFSSHLTGITIYLRCVARNSDL
jgi:hypothetical protein